MVQEVLRIKGEHLDDRNAIFNGRVKGKINVTRAFGVGYLKQPKWNSRLLEAFFKVNYVGTEPYVTCAPSLCHHRIVGSQDKFLVSSDGLYDYFTNTEVVDQVEAFTAAEPGGVTRAAHPRRGDRRKYHDDVCHRDLVRGTNLESESDEVSEVQRLPRCSDKKRKWVDSFEGEGTTLP